MDLHQYRLLARLDPLDLLDLLDLYYQFHQQVRLVLGGLVRLLNQPVLMVQ